ncbi:hypothetical protein L8Y64_05930 [Campylobacter lari]|uniref:hypothetical protein n=1 Tax=Campylobacter lari TaxID=201 RepID=UPI00057EBAFE|nr:hypothetical protein [Campylobacter lari]AJC89568.1 putative membrane protein [Campylobacter lari subsp. concheus LMG 11760]EAH7580709.1 hypothetical protein [Campylobacter lari]EAH8848353.1 hypothetical protein [Campylobacter lari]EAI2145297.1 hypothetical protein [Campylobacter lari]EAI4428948.1 hypothetical protein [Campylobacter lari]
MVFYLLISAIAFLILFFSIKKYTLKLDEQALLEPIKNDIYPEFCDLINEEIRNIKNSLLQNTFTLQNENNKDKFLENLSNMSRKLNHIQTMNLSKKSNALWEEALFGFLKELEKLNEQYLKNSDEINDSIRTSLQEKFSNLTKN